MVVTIAAVGTVFRVLILATLQVLFNGMLLHRAYRSFGSSDNGGSGNSSFFERVSQFLFGIGQLLHLNAAVGTIIYPVDYVLRVLSFDLSTIQVPALALRLQSIVFSTYLFDSLCSSVSSFFLTIAPLLVCILPSAMKIIQYVISYVSISEFFCEYWTSQKQFEL